MVCMLFLVKKRQVNRESSVALIPISLGGRSPLVNSKPLLTAGSVPLWALSVCRWNYISGKMVKSARFNSTRHTHLGSPLCVCMCLCSLCECVQSLQLSNIIYFFQFHYVFIFTKHVYRAIISLRHSCSVYRLCLLMAALGTALATFYT